MDSSSDLEPLWTEIKAARDVLNHIQKMRHGQVNDVTVSVDSEVMMSHKAGAFYVNNM